MAKISYKKMIPLIQDFKTIILANGKFPTNNIPLELLLYAEQVVCCDGAAQGLLNSGIKPDYIIGDLDSVSKEIKKHRICRIYCRLC